MPTKRAKPPEEKKRLSYERDGRNTYGENNKASRKAIPTFKAASNRSARRSVKQAVAAVVQSAHPTDEARLADKAFKGLHPSKRKQPDLPLGLMLESKGKIVPSKAPKRPLPQSVAWKNWHTHTLKGQA